MTSTLFDLSFRVATPFWALMILLPTWSWTKRIISSPLIVAPTLVVWLVLALPMFGRLWTAVTGPSLSLWQTMVTDPAAVALLWTQIIAWDLFIGRWIYLDSRERRVHPLIMAPIMVFTILLSPLGLPLYLVVRAFFKSPTHEPVRS